MRPNDRSIAHGTYPAQQPGDSSQADPGQDDNVLLVIKRRRDSSKDVYSISEYQGYKFVNVRNWQPKRYGGWFPNSSRGFSISPRDLTNVIDALQRAANGLARVAR